MEKCWICHRSEEELKNTKWKINTIQEKVEKENNNLEIINKINEVITKLKNIKSPYLNKNYDLIMEHLSDFPEFLDDAQLINFSSKICNDYIYNSAPIRSQKISDAVDSNIRILIKYIESFENQTKQSWGKIDKSNLYVPVKLHNAKIENSDACANIEISICEICLHILNQHKVTYNYNSDRIESVEGFYQSKFTNRISELDDNEKEKRRKEYLESIGAKHY